MHQLPRVARFRTMHIVLPGFTVVRRQGVIDAVSIALQEAAAIAGQEPERMLLAPPGRVMEHNDRRTGPAMAAIIGDHSPEVSALRASSTGIKNRGAGFINEEPPGITKMPAHVLDDRSEMETGTPHPVAERAAIEADPLPLEDLGLTVEGLVVPELGDDDRGDEPLRRQPAGDDVFGGMSLGDGLRTTPAGVFGTTRHQNPQLCRNHVEPLRDILTDPGHLTASAWANRAGRFDHALHPWQVRREMATVALRGAGGITTRFAVQGGLGFFLCGLDDTLRQFDIFQGQMELIGRELLRAFAELLTLQGVQDILQPTLGLLRIGEHGFDLGQTSLQKSVFPGESGGFHTAK